MSENVCDICKCKVKLSNNLMRMQHVNGKKHQRKLEILNRQKKQLKHGTAEYFMKHNSSSRKGNPQDTTRDAVHKFMKEDKDKRETTDKLMKRLDRLVDKREQREQREEREKRGEPTQTSIHQYSKHPYQSTVDMCPYSIRGILKMLDPQILEYLKELIDIYPECIEMFDDGRFKPILIQNGDNIITLLRFIFNPGNSIKDAFEIFYDNSTMRVYFAELSGKLFGLPFSIRHKIYKFPQKYNLKIFIELFRRYTSDVTTSMDKVCDKIEQIHQYNKISIELESGNMNSAQFLINQNNNERAAFLESTFLEARNSWNKNISKMA